MSIPTKYIKNTSIKCALVSTNSICQGESVPTFCKKMVECGAEIQFARQVATRILFMNEGSIVADGTPEEILDSPEDARIQRFLNYKKQF